MPGAAFSERGPVPRSAAPFAEDHSNARVIVKFRVGSALARSGVAAGRAQHAGPLGRRLSLPLTDGRPLGPHAQGLRGRGLSSAQLAARMAAQPDVEWAVVDQRRHIHAVQPNDLHYAANQTGVTPLVGQWYLRAPDSTMVSAINAEAAWAMTLGSPAITVAVLDTGVRFDHPDLAGKLWPGYDFVSDAKTGADGMATLPREAAARHLQATLDDDRYTDCGNGHDDCSWTCEECGCQTLTHEACMGCFDACEADEPMDKIPDDRLCRECHKSLQVKEVHKPEPPMTELTGDQIV